MKSWWSSTSPFGKGYFPFPNNNIWQESVKRKNYCSHTPCKQTSSMTPLWMKTEWACWGLETNRTKCRKENHSVIRITLFFWPCHITTLWPQRSDSSQGTLRPPVPIREIRPESSQEQKSFLAKQPKHPAPPHPAGVPEQQEDCRLNLKQHQRKELEKAQMVNCSRVCINYKEPDVTPDR